MWTLFLALRYFRTRRRERMISVIGLISVLGIALGVASLVVVLSVMNGFDEEVRSKIIGTYSHIIVTRHGGLEPDDKVLTEVLGENPDVVAWAPFIAGQAVIRDDDFGKGVMVRGILPEREMRVTDLASYVDSPGDLEPGKVFIGSEIMRSSYLVRGDTFELLSPYSAFDIEKKRLEVAGSFRTGRFDYDNNMVIVHMRDAGELFRTGGLATGMGLRTTDAMNARSIKRDLASQLSAVYGLRTWMELDENLVKALALEKKMMFIVLTLIIMVACFNIAGSLIMMVMEKTRDIGILKALGATNPAVSAVFMFEAVLTGLLGVLAGVAAGRYVAVHLNEILGAIERATGFDLFPSDVYYFTHLPVRISQSDIVTVSVVAMALTVLAGLYPARRAARLEPVEAIRYE